MTSAVRDAANGAEFAADGARALRARGRDALRRRGGAADVPRRHRRARATTDAPLLVIDIGGGSTELVVGAGGDVDFHVSTQVGVVRHTERHLHSDPPTAGRAAPRWPADARGVDRRPRCPRTCVARATAAVGVAGTATQLASIDLELEHDRDRVEGHALTARALEELRDRLAAVPLEERQGVQGLDPARAPTIVAGRHHPDRGLGAFGLDGVEVSERDILWGVALDTGRNG